MNRAGFIAGTLSASVATGDLAAANSPERAVHERNMRLAIQEANANPRYPFGAVIVNATGDVLARGVNGAAAHPAHHGEMVAIDDYVARHGNRGWAATTLYTTAEPCAMCAGAIVWAGIPRIVYASSTPFIASIMDQMTIRTKAVIAASPFYRNELLLGGVLAAQTDRMFRERAV